MTRHNISQKSRVLLRLALITACAHLQCMNQRDIDNAKLVVAAQNGDLDAVRHLLEPRAFVNTICCEKQGDKTMRATPLRQAAQQGHVKVVEHLLHNNANPNLITDLSPLYIATHNNHTQAAVLLLAAKAEPNATDDKGCTPLILAADQGNKILTAGLLNAKASVDTQTKDHGTTALIQAAQNGHRQSVELLLAAKAHVNKARTNGTTPLHVAVRNNHAGVVEALMAAGANRDALDVDDKLPAYYAQTDAMRALLQRAPEVSESKNDTQSRSN